MNAHAPFSNLPETLHLQARHHPHAVALITDEQSWTYEALWQKVIQLAQGLQDEGIGPGSHVGLLFYNVPHYVMSFYAILSLNAVVIPLNARLTAYELSAILKDANAVALLTDHEFEDTLTMVDVPSLRHLFIQGMSTDKPLTLVSGQRACPWPEAPLAAAIAKEPDLKTITLNQLATLVYTSGTTGHPKGVMLSHGNILADALANVQVIEATASDRFITISPLFHVFGQTNVMVTALMTGASLILVKKFSPRKVLEAIDRHQATFMAAVPTMYQLFLSHLREHRYDLSSIRVCHSGAAAMPVPLIAEIEAVFDAPVQEGYGLSEASSIVCANPLHGPRKPGSVGQALAGIQVRVVDELGLPVPPGTVGELEVQGPIVMQGYLNRPQETQEALVGGWLKTKDLGYEDEAGYLYIVDRKDDLMNVGGVKVYPREVEEVLYQHPSVLEVAVVGRPSSLYHQEIKAYIVLKPGSKPNSAQLQTHCRTRLAEYKIPKHIFFVTEIPKGATGKILRKALS